MKKLNIIFSVLMTLFLSVSLIPPVSVYASPQDDPQTALTNLAKPKDTKEVLVKIINNTNRYITLSLDHRKEYHVYTLSIAPGMNQFWLYSGAYKYVYDVTESCGKVVYGHTTFNPGSKLRIGCPGKKH